MSQTSRARGAAVAAAVHVTVFGVSSATAWWAGPSLGLPNGTWWVLALVALIGIPFAVLLGRNPQGLLTGPATPSPVRPTRRPQPKSGAGRELATAAQGSPWGRAASGGPGVASRPQPTDRATPVQAPSEAGRPPPPRRAARELDERGVVVLPFAVTGGDPTIEYLAEGVAEEILMGLGMLGGSRIPARGSAFSFERSGASARDFATRLGVAYVLQGSISREVRDLTVSARLVRVADGRDVWNRDFGCTLGTLSETTAEVIDLVARDRGFIQRGNGRPLSGGRRTSVAGALDSYLKGRFQWHRRGDGLERSAMLFEQAIRADPEFALGYAGRADANMLLGFYGYMDPKAAFQNASESAERALELDDSLPEAWTALGFVRSFYEWDWSRSEVSFKRAVDLNRSYVGARFWYGMSLGVTGRLGDWVRHDLTALKADPLSVFANAHLGWALLGARAYQEAEARFSNALAKDPSFSLAYWLRGRARIYGGDLSAGVADLIEGAKQSRGNPVTLGTLGYALAKSGDFQGAQRQLENLQAGPTGWRWVRPSQIATVQLGLGRIDDALTGLELALEDKDFWLPLTVRRPEWDEVRDHERFRAVVSGLGLEEVPEAEYAAAARAVAE